MQTKVMRMKLERGDPDFEQFTATLNGEFLRHDVLVSADAALGVVVRNKTDGDGNVIGDGPANRETIEGFVRIVERNESVRAKEPQGARVNQTGVEPQAPSEVAEPAPEADEDPAPRKGK